MGNQISDYLKRFKNQTIGSVVQTVQAFPLVTIFLVGLTVLVNMLIWQENDPESWLVKLTITAFLVVVIFVIIDKSLATTQGHSSRSIWDKIEDSLTKKKSQEDRHYLQNPRWYMLVVLTLLAGLGYYFLLPADINVMTQSDWILYGLLQGLAVIGVLVVPLFFVKKERFILHSSAVYLLMQLLIATVFVLVLAGGISLALTGIDALFDISIDGNWYGSIFSSVAILLGGLSMLDGIDTWNLRDTLVEKTKKWKRLLGGVVLVLLCIYAVILYVYLAKILVTGVWPSNEVTTWAFVYSALVVLGSVLFVPLIDFEGFWNYRHTQNILYASLLPVIGMSAVAIWLRVDQYGVTHERYFVIVVLIGLIIGVGLMLGKKEKQPYWVLVTLFVLVLIGAIGGPLSATSISKNSQQARLENMLEEDGVGNMQALETLAASEEVDTDKKRLIADQIIYLTERFGPKSVQEWTGELSNSPREQLEAVGLEQVRPYAPKFPSSEFDIYRNVYMQQTNSNQGEEPLSIGDFSRLYSGFYPETYQVTDGTILEMRLDNEIVRVDLGVFLRGLEEQFSVTDKGERAISNNDLFYVGTTENEETIGILFERLSYGINKEAENEVWQIEYANFDLYRE